MTGLHEWPLVLFTLTVQLAVGLHLALLSTTSLLQAGYPAQGPALGTRDPYLWVGVLMAGALAASLLHHLSLSGYPLKILPASFVLCVFLRR